MECLQHPKMLSWEVLFAGNFPLISVHGVKCVALILHGIQCTIDPFKILSGWYGQQLWGGFQEPGISDQQLVAHVNQSGGQQR